MNRLATINRVSKLPADDTFQIYIFPLEHYVIAKHAKAFLIKIKQTAKNTVKLTIIRSLSYKFIKMCELVYLLACLLVWILN